MKLPTLNVDVKVNTAGMKRDIANANKELQTVGGKGLAFAGGAFGKVGALGSLGGGAGSLAIGGAGIALAAAAPIMAAGKIVDSFAATMKTAEQTMQEFARTGRTTTGMTAVQAITLREQAQETGAAPKSAGFFGGISQGFAASGGGMIGQWAENTLKGATWLGTLLGGAIGGIGGGTNAEEIVRQADLSIAGSEQEARQLFTRDELKELDSTMRNFARQQREATT